MLLRLDPEDRDALRTYVELMTMFDNPKFPDQLSPLGNDPAKWTWGGLHTATFENETLGRSGIGPIEEGPGASQGPPLSKEPRL